MQAAKVAHPNEIIADEIKARGWAFEDLVRESGLSLQVLCEPKISRVKAEGLAKAFGTAPEFWLNLQTAYDAWQERDRMMSAHTIQAAMWRGELTEEEAYFILRFAGRMGYSKAIKRLSNPIKNIRQWFIWIGGWEYSELSQWDRGKPAWQPIEERQGKKRLQDPTPISLFGHTITVFDRWFEIKCFGGSLNVMFPNYHNADHWVYWSPNGTPQHPDAKVLIPKKAQREQV